MSVRLLQPCRDVCLSSSELVRLETAIRDAEFQILAAAAPIPDGWVRIIDAPVLASQHRSGCYGIHLISRSEPDLFTALEYTPRRWWHRFTDWWWKW